MGMLGSLVYIEVVQQAASEGTLRQHTLHGVADKLLYTTVALTQLGRSLEALATRITCVTGINLIGLFLTSEYYLIGIDKDFPRISFATLEARRPTTWSVASITTHSFFAVSLFTESVL